MPETTAPGLVRRDGVELIRTGSWQISTGRWDASREDLAAAVAAMSCPAVRKPVLKIGHVDQRFTGDGEPAIGWVDNLRLADGGHTLIGDYNGMPAWLDSILASAYPDRSVEGAYNHRCQLGHTHPFALTGVALLGVTPPGVGTLKSLNSLADVKALYGLAASADPAPGEVRIAAAIPGSLAAAVEQQHTGAMVALIPTAEDAARLAVEGGEPANELHVTLAYLGDAADLDSAARQDIFDTVSSAVNGMPTVEADAFALSAFNPARTDRDTCIVLGMSGDDLDMVHTLVANALAELDVPEQHTPWVAHMTLIYTEDISRLTELTDRIGPVRFDRVRIALAGQHIDIPLVAEPDDADEPGEVAAATDENQLKRYWLGEGLSKWATKPHPWTALYRHLRKYVGSERAKRIASQWFHDHFGYWPGDRRHRKASAVKEGEQMPNPESADADRIRAAWNATAPHEQWIVEVADDHVIVTNETDRSFLRVPVKVGDTIKFGTPVPVRPGYVTEPVAASVVYASRAESRPDLDVTWTVPGAVSASTPTPPDVEPEPVQQDPHSVDDLQLSAEPEADPEPPAAEPEPAPSTEPKEDPVSTLSTDVRSRLGLPEDADDAAILAAVDALKTQAANPEPDPQQVAAAAAATQEADELRKEVKVLASQVETMSTKLANAEKEKAATIKASVIDAAVKQGKIAPAERAQWEADYDEAPNAITRVLASIAPGTAVPVNPLGETGSPEAVDVDAEWAAVQHLFPAETVKER